MNQLPSNYPREGFDEVDEPEIQQIDPRIPANEYTRPRVTSRSEPAQDEEFQATVTRAVKASESDWDTEPAAPAPSKGNSTSIFGLEDIEPPKTSEPPKSVDSPKFDTDPYTVKPVAMSNSMFDFEPAQGSSKNTIHGPSFLGLSEPEFLDEDDEESSHGHRTWLLLALAVVIVVAAVQWRNIRDTGMHYAGTLHFKLPLKKGDGQAQVAQEKAAPGDSGENSAASEGKPEMEVSPTTNGAAPANQQNATADQNQAGQQNLLSAQGAESKPPQPTDSSKSTSNTANATPAEESQTPDPSAEKGAGDTAASKNDGQGNASKSPGKSSKKTEVAEAVPPKSKSERVSRAKETESTEPPAPKAAPGADDVARAISASDPATAANWLWAATKKGNKEAPVLLADYYAKGRGVPKDCEQATVLLRSAARAGNPHASARLGMYYATGQCVGQDRAEAWHWLSLAHEKDPASDWVEQYRRRLWTEMTPEERARSGSGPSASE
jgi:TPR repeat protein